MRASALRKVARSAGARGARRESSVARAAGDSLRPDSTTFRCEPDGIEARIALGAPALEPSVRNQPPYKVGGARPVDAGCRHDIGLAQTIRLGDRLKDSELARREDIVDMARKQAIRPLAGAMQKMQCGLQRR